MYTTNGALWRVHHTENEQEKSCLTAAHHSPKDTAKRDIAKISNIQEVIAISHKRYHPRSVVGSCEAQETPMTSRNASEHYTIYLVPL
jgi:hypothetical protein